MLKFLRKIFNKRTDYNKLKKEIDWAVEHKEEFLYNADNNFGLFPEHKDITEYIVNKKKKTGYPHIMRNDWAKGRADKVMPIAKMLHDAGLQKGVTVALQSMNKETLKAIKRKNIDNGKLKEFVKLYIFLRRINIPKAEIFLEEFGQINYFFRRICSINSFFARIGVLFLQEFTF
mgnify:CR=1 FL=1